MKKTALACAAICATLAESLIACEEQPAKAPAPASSVEAPPSAGSQTAPPVASSAPTSSGPAIPAAPLPPPPLAELQLTALRVASEAMNAHEPRRYASLFTRNAIHKEASAEDIHGQEEITARMAYFMRSFGDLKFQFDRVWQRDAVAVATWRWTGTDTGGFVERKPTQRRAGLMGASVGFFNADGKIREIHLYEDGVTALSQLDASAKPGSFREAPLDPTGQEPRASQATNGPEEASALDASKRLYAAIEGRDQAALTALVADDAIIEDMATPPRAERGKAAITRLLGDWQKTFGAFTELPLYNQLAVGETVIAERVLTTTMNRKIVKLHALDIAEWKDGKLQKLTVFSNTLELWGQIGPTARR